MTTRLIGRSSYNKCIYHLTQTAAKAVNELQHGQGANKVVRKDLVLDSLEQKGMLATPSGKSRSYNKTINSEDRMVTAVNGQSFNVEVEEEK